MSCPVLTANSRSLSDRYIFFWLRRKRGAGLMDLGWPINDVFFLNGNHFTVRHLDRDLRDVYLSNDAGSYHTFRFFGRLPWPHGNAIRIPAKMTSSNPPMFGAIC